MGTGGACSATYLIAAKSPEWQRGLVFIITLLSMRAIVDAHRGLRDGTGFENVLGGLHFVFGDFHSVGVKVADGFPVVSLCVVVQSITR